MSDYEKPIHKTGEIAVYGRDKLKILEVENAKLKEENKKKDELLEAVLVNLKAFSINTPNIHSFLVGAIGSILNEDKK